MNKILLLIIVFIIVAASFVYAYCSSPSEPYGGVPSTPFCAAPLGGVGKCNQWEIDSYKDEIERYIKKWNVYAEEAAEAAQCKQKEAIDGCVE